MSADRRPSVVATDLHRFTGRLVKPGVRTFLSTAFRQPGFVAVALYRWQSLLFDKGQVRRAQMVYHLNLALTNADLLPGSDIGPGLMIRHATGIVVGAGAQVGADCTILQGVTLGTADLTSRDHAAYPRVGNRVTIGAGALLIGGIIVGDDATIGAGSVVVRNVEPGETVVGNPARPVPRRAN